VSTHTGYFKAGVMTQDLIWEQYQYPVALKTRLEANSSVISRQFQDGICRRSPCVVLKMPHGFTLRTLASDHGCWLCASFLVILVVDCCRRTFMYS